MAYSENHAFSTAMAALRILEILKETDKDHPITQAQIADMIGYDRKAVARTLNIMESELPDFELVRCRDGVYYEKSGSDFDLYEIRMLCDSILSSKIVSARETKTLLEKLGKLVSERERKKIPHITTCNARIKTDHQQTMLNVDILNEAIIKKCQVAFDYMAYGRDKKLHKVDTYQVSPYQLIFSGGFYLLLATVGEDETLRPFRIDLMKMTNDSILENVPAVKESRYGQREAETTLYVEGHPYMQVGVLEEIRAEIKEADVGRAIDAFGKNIRIYDGENEGELYIAFKANTEDAYLWALENGDVATVLEPQSLRNRLRRISGVMNNNYLKYGTDHLAANMDAITGNVPYPLAKYFNKPRLQTGNIALRRQLAELGAREQVKEIILNLYNAEIAEEMKQYVNLEKLLIPGFCDEYDDNTEMKDLSCLASLKRLRKLEISREELTDASALFGMPELETLDIRFTGISDISFIRSLPSLKRLDIGGKHITDFSPLYEATGIEVLYIDDLAKEKIDMEKLYEANPNVNVK